MRTDLQWHDTRIHYTYIFCVIHNKVTINHTYIQLKVSDVYNKEQPDVPFRALELIAHVAIG